MKHYILILSLLFTTVAYAQEDVVTSPPGKDELVEQEELSDEDEESDGEYEEEESSSDHVVLKPQETKALQEFQSEKLYHEGFDENTWREVVGDNDYKQQPEPPPVKMPGLTWAGPLMKAIGYGVVAAIIILLLYIVLKNIKVNKKVKQVGVAPYTSDDVEDIREMDIPALLQQALTEKNFKLAVRLYFLLLLRNLHDAGMIKWEKDKTNRDYLTELFSKENLYDDVRSLTIRYEEVWYGDHHFPEASLLALISRFESIQSKINPLKSL